MSRIGQIEPLVPVRGPVRDRKQEEGKSPPSEREQSRSGERQPPNRRGDTGRVDRYASGQRTLPAALGRHAGTGCASGRDSGVEPC